MSIKEQARIRRSNGPGEFAEGKPDIPIATPYMLIKEAREELEDFYNYIGWAYKLRNSAYVVGTYSNLSPVRMGSIPFKHKARLLLAFHINKLVYWILP